jgi:signal transduction histidine kinase
MKHSYANQAKLIITNATELTIIVTDNGRGFDMNDLSLIEGFGLHQIRQELNASTVN